MVGLSYVMFTQYLHQENLSSVKLPRQDSKNFLPTQVPSGDFAKHVSPMGRTRNRRFYGEFDQVIQV